MDNKFAGGPSSLTGPPAALQGALGNAPQQVAPPNLLTGAAPVTNGPGPTPNMLATVGGRIQQAAPPPQPPSPQQMIEAAHRSSYVSAVLKSLMVKPNLTGRDVINAVGEMIAEQVMDIFMAGKYLADLPEDPSQVRQWVSQHYATSMKTLDTLRQMIAASGRASRQRAMAASRPHTGLAMPPNLLTGAAPGRIPQAGPPPMYAPHNMLGGAPQ